MFVSPTDKRPECHYRTCPVCHANLTRTITLACEQTLFIHPLTPSPSLVHRHYLSTHSHHHPLSRTDTIYQPTRTITLARAQALFFHPLAPSPSLTYRHYLSTHSHHHPRSCTDTIYPPTHTITLAHVQALFPSS